METDHGAQDSHGFRSDRWTGLLFGLLAGATLLVVTYGIDGWILARADGSLPWTKTLLGAACLLLPLALLGWLSLRLRRALPSGISWLLAGVLFGLLAAQITFRLLPSALASWTPDAPRPIAYDFSVGPSARGLLSSIFCGLVFFVAGLLIRDLADSWRLPAYPASRAITILVWVGLFALAGGVVDGFVNRPLRIPIVTVDKLIAYRLSNPDWKATETAKLLHASVLNPAKDLLPRRHRLVVANYDETVTTIQVLVDFEGSWIECTLFGSEPIFCQTVE
jgi:hypothetical protein